MKYAQNRALRKKLSLAFGARAFQDNPQNNQQNVLDIVKLRHQRAQLLGYKSHAHFVLEERMAESPQKVHAFLNELLVKARPAAQKEFDELEAFAKKLDGIDQLQKWDSAYYAEKLKQENVAIYAIEQTENSIMLNDFQPELNKKYALIFGNEVKGVNQKAINISDGVIEIPQLGSKHSLNISVTAGIVIWDLFQKM